MLTMKLLIDIDYRRKSEAVQEISNSELTLDYFEYAVGKKYPQGASMSGTKRRTFARISRKMEDAIEDGLTHIELNDAERDFLKTVFKEELEVDPRLAKYFVELETVVEDFLDATKGEQGNSEE